MKSQTRQAIHFDDSKRLRRALIDAPRVPRRKFEDAYILMKFCMIEAPWEPTTYI